MTEYIAFLRAINVGGRTMIKMDALRLALESAGLKSVRTYIQSGNVIFRSKLQNRQSLIKKMRAVIAGLGHDVSVVVITLAELEDVVRNGPFNQFPGSKDSMLFVVWLAGEPLIKVKLPFASPSECLDVIGINSQAMFVVGRRKKNGSFDFPNNFLEKQLGIKATTRNWSTVVKLLEFAKNST
ncbi:MAG: DUF1697 domain-containing protein [Pyrinomonadaceae bacterium]